MTKTKKISKTSDTSIIEQRTFFWRKSFRSSHEMLESSGKFEMFSHGQPWPQHRGGNFSRTNKTLWIMNYAWGRPNIQYNAFYRSLLLFSPLFPSFFLILNFPLEAYIKIQKRFCWLDPQPSTPTTVTAQQLAVGECWAGLGLSCWVELETQVSKLFTIAEKAHTKAFSWLKALTLDSLSQREGSCRAQSRI